VVAKKGYTLVALKDSCAHRLITEVLKKKKKAKKKEKKKKKM